MDWDWNVFFIGMFTYFAIKGVWVTIRDAWEGSKKPSLGKHSRKTVEVPDTPKKEPPF